MKFLKVLFLSFLFLIACFSLYHLVTIDNITGNVYLFVIFSVFLFAGCFLRVALKIKLGGKYLSLEEEFETLQVEQQKLSKITTALYKLSRINVALKDIKGSSARIAKLNFEIRDEIKKYLNKENLESFNNLLCDIIKNPN